MKKLGLGILIGIMVLALLGASLTVAQGRPINGNDKAQVPEIDKGTIERGVFIDYGHHSPPWFYQECGQPEYETDKYQWAPKIHWANDDLPLNITVYTGNEPISGTFSPIKAGFTVWDEETGATLYGPITENAASGPGVILWDGNTVQWGTIDGSGGIIGVTYYWYWTNTKEMVEFDIILDKDEPWSLDEAPGTFDVQNIATHEVGHTLVLGDIRSPKDCGLTMHAYTWWGDTLKRTLAPGDVLGVRAIYGE